MTQSDDWPSTAFPMPSFVFRLQWEDAELCFAQMSGLDIGDASEVASEFRMSCKTDQMSLVTLNLGTFISELLFEQWCSQCQTSPFSAGSAIVSLVDDEGQSTFAWKLLNPSLQKIAFSQNASGNELSIEELVIGHQGIELIA